MFGQLLTLEGGGVELNDHNTNRILLGVGGACVCV